MSDHSPWMPPAPGEPEPALPDVAVAGDDAVTPPAPSPWARPAGGGDDASSSGDAGVAVSEAAPAARPDVPPVVAPESPSTIARHPAPMGPPAAPLAGAPWSPDAVSVDPTHHVAPTTGRTGRRRSPLLVVTATVAVVAIGIAGIFAATRIAGAPASGGATPEDVGEQLLAAIEGEDVLGMIDVLLPGERESLGQPFIATMGELQRLEVLSADLDLSRLLGVDVELSNETVSSTSTNVGDIAHLRLGADVVATLDGATLPIGDLVTDRLPPEMLTELRGTRTTEVDRFDVDLTVVEFEGRWYVSLLHTAAEAVRDGARADRIPVEGLAAAGGESPDDAVDRMFAAVSSLDVRAMIQLLDPTEAMALQRYAPLFLDDAEAAVAEFPGVIRVTDHQVRLEGSGDRRTAFIEAFSAEMSLDGDTASMAYADGCWRVEETFTGESLEMCDGLGASTAGLELPTEIDALVDAFTDAFADMEAVGLELRERDGEWFVSPMASATEAMLAAMRALDRAELDRIIDAVPPAAESLLPWIFGGFDELTGNDLSGGMLDELGFDDPVFDDPMMDDPVFDDPAFDDPGFELPAVDRCYGEIDTSDAVACFAEVLAEGDAEPWEVPVQMRFPECGLAEVTWSGEIYGMSDDEFTATIAAATPCFERLVAEDRLERWEVPSEVANLACFEGRNWYGVFDDQEFIDRVFECTATLGEG